MRKILWGLVLVTVFAGVCSAQTTLYFPQFVDGFQGSGTGYFSAFGVTNPAAIGTPAATGTVTLTQDNGAPLSLTLTDENGQPAGNTFQLAGGQTKFFFSPQRFASSVLPLSSGFVTLTSSLPLSGGLVFFEFSAIAGLIGEAGVPAALPLTRQETFVVNTNSNTGVAVANPGTTTANITFQLLDKSGALIVPQITRTLPPNNHTSFFVTDLFPSAPSTIYATMRMTSDNPVVSTVLQFQQNGVFATLPILPLQ